MARHHACGVVPAAACGIARKRGNAAAHAALGLHMDAQGQVNMDSDQQLSAPEDWAEHERTYRGFVKGVVVFTAHVFVILLFLAWVFAGNFNVPAAAG
jgi:aa3 type cytochrome c oxidase subunit IV